MTYPIPSDALDDRLAWVGATGSGKTYNAGSGVERLMASGARVVIIDPLDVWWGLRLAEDGKTPSRFSPVIFGGPQGDLPLNERAGGLLGETVAAMRESCIISLADFRSTASERRFMLDFLAGLDRNANREPVHLVFDEADLWAPQLVLDKEGDANKLLGQMQTIVRRGRVKGFIPWLITQRPAEISKGVLSQIDGMVAFKLTASQDRDAIWGWIKGQADTDVGKAILASLPAMQQGQGVVWVPGRGVLETAQFPAKATFDSSRTPKRGEKKRSATLKPLDLGKLKDRMAAVEAEAKANDPKALKAEVARLTKELAAKAPAGPDPAALADAERRGFATGKAEGFAEGLLQSEGIFDRVRQAAREANEQFGEALGRIQETVRTASLTRPTVAAVATRPVFRPNLEAPRPSPPAAPRQLKPAVGAPVQSGPVQKLIDAVAAWNALGIAEPSINQVGFLAGYTPTAGTFNRYRSQARSDGFIDYPAPGRIALTEAGVAAAAHVQAAVDLASFHAAVRDKLDGPLVKLLDPLLEAYPAALTAGELAERAGYTANAGTFNRYRSSLRSLEIIEYPATGQVRAADWLFPQGVE